MLRVVWKHRKVKQKVEKCTAMKREHMVHEVSVVKSSASKMLEKAVININRQVGDASTAPL